MAVTPHLADKKSSPLARTMLAASLSVAGACDDGGEDVADFYDDQHTDSSSSTEDEIESIREAHVVASLTFEGSGTLEIVTDGAANASISYVLIGGSGIIDIMRQLDAQDASPAEVFASLTEPGTPIPPQLVEDHRQKAARGETPSSSPRTLQFSTFRTIETNTDYCPGTLSDFLDDWEVDFEDYYSGVYASQWSFGFGTYNWTVPASNNARVISVCETTDDAAPALVTYKYWTLVGGTTWQWVIIWSGYVYDNDAVHLYSSGFASSYNVQVNSPNGRFYLAYDWL